VSSENVRLIDQRVRMGMRGTETVRGTVVSTVVGNRVSVRVAGSTLTAIVPALPETLAVGSVVEVQRPRGITGQLHVVRVLGAQPDPEPVPFSIYYNVEDFGLVGDGVTDDAPAFRAMVAGAQPGSRFYFPGTTYLLASTADPYDVGFPACVDIHTSGIELIGRGGRGNISSYQATDGDTCLKADDGLTEGAFDLIRWVGDEGANEDDETSVVDGGGITGMVLDGLDLARRVIDIRGGVWNLVLDEVTFARPAPSGHAIHIGDTPGLMSEATSWTTSKGHLFQKCKGAALATGAGMVKFVQNTSSDRFVACDFNTHGGGHVYEVYWAGPELSFVGCTSVAYFGGRTLYMHPRYTGVGNWSTGVQVLGCQGFTNIEVASDPGDEAENVTVGHGLVIADTGDAGRDYGDGETPMAPVVALGHHLWYIDDMGRNNLRRDLRISQAPLVDDFLNGDTTGGAIGQLGWRLAAVGGGSVNYLDPTDAQLGGRSALYVVTGAVSGDLTAIGIGGSNVGMVDPESSWIMEWLFRPTTLTNTTHRLGLLNSAAITDNPPTNGIYVEKLTGETPFYGVCRSGGVQTRTQLLAVPVSTDWYHLTIIRRPTSVEFQYRDMPNDFDGAVVSTNIPTVRLAPWAHVRTSTSSAMSMYIDAFQLTINGLSR
jgi:hypothetical protein